MKKRTLSILLTLTLLLTLLPVPAAAAETALPDVQLSNNIYELPSAESTDATFEMENYTDTDISSYYNFLLYDDEAMTSPVADTVAAVYADDGLLTVSYIAPPEEIKTHWLRVEEPGGAFSGGTCVTIKPYAPFAAPELSHESGFYAEPITVSISAEQAGLVIYYTLNGGEPVLYADPITISEDTELTAFVTQNNLTAEVSANYTFTRRYPITIIGPTATMSNVPAITLDHDMIVESVQGSSGALFNPKEGSNNAAALTDWVYNGWLFTADFDGDNATYGPTKTLDEGLVDFLTAFIADGATLTMDSKTPGVYRQVEPISNDDSSTGYDDDRITKVSDNGTLVIATKAADGGTAYRVTVPTRAMQEANGGPVELPTPPLDGGTGADTIKITLPGGTAKYPVSIPLQNPQPGVVAVKDGTAVPSAVSGSRLVFTAQNGQTYSLENRRRSFSDLSPSHTFYADMTQAAANGWLEGYDDGSIAPAGKLTPAAAGIVFSRVMGNLFSGLTAVERAKAWLVQAGYDGLISATLDGSADRGSMFRMIYTAAGSPAVDTSVLARFSDASSLTGVDQQAAAFAVGNGISLGNTDGTLGLNSPLTRGASVALLMRALGKGAL